jgi:hypothetical protein
MTVEAATRAVGTIALSLGLAVVALESAAASDDATRNQFAAENCVRGKFKDYYLQGAGGDPSVDYKGRVFKLSQDYPDRLPPMEHYPWLKIPFKDGGPVDPEAYLRALLAYGLEGNVEVDFHVEDNKIRKWYGMPWMDWNTEVASDWPGTDGREFVHGFTHEFDSFAGTLSAFQDVFVDTWSGAYFNDRAGFSIGQVYCNPDDPRPGMVNPDPTALNNMADGAYVIKLLFSTVSEPQLPTVAKALEWDANVFANEDPADRNKGPWSKYQRKMGKIRMIQIDVAVRDERSITGWLLGTFGYDARARGKTPWERMVPLGIQWGNSPTVTYDQTCAGPNGPCSYEKLTEQWINLQAVKDLATPPLNFNHLGFGGRLAGPVDNPKASCMGCHQTAGFPNVAILPEFGPNASLLALDAQKEPGRSAGYRMMFYGNVPSGIVFSDTQLYSSDYSLQLSMSLQNFASLRCAAGAPAPRPSLCDQFAAWATAQQNAIKGLMLFGTPGADGGPIPAN